MRIGTVIAVNVLVWITLVLTHVHPIAIRCVLFGTFVCALKIGRHECGFASTQAVLVLVEVLALGWAFCQALTAVCVNVFSIAWILAFVCEGLARRLHAETACAYVSFAFACCFARESLPAYLHKLALLAVLVAFPLSINFLVRRAKPYAV